MKGGTRAFSIKGEYSCRNHGNALHWLLWKHANEDWSMSFNFFKTYVSLEKWQYRQGMKLSLQTPSLLAWVRTTLRTGMKAEVSLKLLVLTMWVWMVNPSE